jgi:Tfp pilus assembly protein PilO
MGARHADRIWMVGGVVAAALLLAMGWFLAISPKNAEAEDLGVQQEDTESRMVVLRKRLNDLEEQNTKVEQYRAAFKRNRAALPVDSGVPDFLRQLQDSGELVDVTVSGVTVNAPVQVGSQSLYELPITVTADGTASDLGRFLDQLQQVQPRAVLVESANMATTGEDTTVEKLTMTLAMKAFVAPEAGQPAPTVTTTG